MTKHVFRLRFIRKVRFMTQMARQLRVWSTDTGEYGLDGYLGNTRIKFCEPRTLDRLCTKTRAGYIPERIRLTGIVLSVATESATLELGMHRVSDWPVDINVVTLGGDWRVGNWRTLPEYRQRDVRDSTIGIGSGSGYVTISRRLAAWVPHIRYARILSFPKTREIYSSSISTPVPVAAQLPPLGAPAN